MSERKCEYCGETHPGRTAFGCDYLHPRPATTSERKLSEELREAAIESQDWSEGVYSDDLNRFAERAAALEAELEKERAMYASAQSAREAKHLRCEALEAEVAKLSWVEETAKQLCGARDALAAQLAKAKEEMARDATELRTLDALKARIAEAVKMVNCFDAEVLPEHVRNDILAILAPEGEEEK